MQDEQDATPAESAAADAQPMPSIEAMVDMASRTVASLRMQRDALRSRRHEINAQIRELNDGIRKAERVASALKPRTKAGA